ncbi:hypothetical protein DIPPA_13902 [Diplonema papillatum]|nr:hypothetical protein DIPPA_13902 [Diplonema papillatum]
MGSRIAVCVEHSTTKCGECKTAAACCRSGHHAMPHAWQRNLPRMQEAPYADAEETGSVLPPRPPPTQRTERPGNPRTQQKEEETPLTRPGGRTTRNAGGKARILPVVKKASRWLIKISDNLHLPLGYGK